MEASPMIDAVDVIRAVGPQAFGRGRDIVRAGGVVDAVWDAEAQEITGRVEGTAADPYECRITMRAARGDFLRPGRSTCACPIGGDCKHVAAVLLTVNARALAATAATPAAPVADSPAPDWRDEVARLAGSASPVAGSRHTPLGLQFELRDSVPARLASRAARSGAIRTPAGPRRVRLGVRPVTRSDAGNWVRSGLTWGTLPYSMNRLGLDPEQHAWMLQFQALQRTTLMSGLPGESDWVHLDDFASPLLWPLLAEAERLGIALVIGKQASGVTVGTDARVVLDASRTADGGIDLGALATLDGLPVPAGAAGTIGSHGLYAFRESPSLRIVLAPTSAPITDDQRRMLVDRARITVPAGAAEEFLAEWSPKLRGAVDLVSANGSVELPERTPPQLVLTATYAGDDVLHLTWRWHVDGRRDPVSMHGPLSDPTTFPVPPDGPVIDSFGDLTLEGADTAAFTAEILPALQARSDLRVVVLGEQASYTRLTDGPEISVTAMESSDKHDWFDLGIMVTVQGRLVPFTPLLAALASRQRKLKLVDNSYMSLMDPVFDRLKALIEEARGLAEWEPGRPLRITPYQAGLWSEFDQLADEAVASSRWESIVGGLLAFAGSGEPMPVAPLPSSVHAELRPYQHEGFSWLHFLVTHGLGGVLADDMGLGKTLQTLAMIAAVSRPHPFLVVAPTSVVGNWAAEAARFVPSLTVRTIDATTLKDPALVTSAADGADIVVTSYALLRLDARAYSSVAWSGLVLDEAQFVKNPQSQTHRIVADLDVPVKLAITGTPLENGLTDLWALFSIVAPGLLSSQTRFADDYVKPLASPDLQGSDRAALTARLRSRIRPLMLRRTKASVAADLPPKQEQVVHVSLDPAHRDLYETTLNRERLKLLDLVDDLDQHRMIVFRSLTLLRMLALSPALVDPSSTVPSAKLELLVDELQQLAAEGRRALVFSQFTSFLGLVSAALDARGVPYEYLDGSTPARARTKVIDRFRSGDAPAFLISLKAGGFGLTLTEADTVFVLDPWWNPAAESQAIDRTHRIGQTSAVQVHRLIAENTIEEKVLALAARKAELFDTMIDEGGLFSAALTPDDVRSLLA
jgi:superfamily II DNA or RNA helicase